MKSFREDGPTAHLFHLEAAAAAAQMQTAKHAAVTISVMCDRERPDSEEPEERKEDL